MFIDCSMAHWFNSYFSQKTAFHESDKPLFVLYMTSIMNFMTVPPPGHICSVSAHPVVTGAKI